MTCTEGMIEAGDEISVEHRPARGLTIEAVNRIYYGDEKDVSPLHTAPELAAHRREWANHRTVWHLDEEAKRGEA